MSLIKSLSQLLFVWSAKMAAIGLVSFILFVSGLVLLLPAIGLVISVYTLNWLLNTSLGQLLRSYLANLIQKYYPLPPGHYVKPLDDYGRRLGMNLKKLRESQSVAGDLSQMGGASQSKSVGGFLVESILDHTTHSGLGSPRSHESSEDEQEPDLLDLTSLPGSHIPRSRSLTLPVKNISADDLDRSREETAGATSSMHTNSSAHESPNRLTSPPIAITKSIRVRGHAHAHTDFPLTDGAMAEFAALSSTPLSNPSFFT